MDSHSRKAWEQLPHETDKAYAAFFQYIQMPVHDKITPQNERSLYNLSVKMGYSVQPTRPSTTVEIWSSKYNWRERANAYDAHMAQNTLTVVERELGQYQHAIIEKRTEQLVQLEQILDLTLKNIKADIVAGGRVDPLELQRVAKAIEITDNLTRRIAKLPTSYTTERAEEVEDDVQVYLIGG